MPDPAPVIIVTLWSSTFDMHYQVCKVILKSYLIVKYNFPENYSKDQDMYPKKAKNQVIMAKILLEGQFRQKVNDEIRNLVFCLRQF